jgi:hypothetical protein
MPGVSRFHSKKGIKLSLNNVLLAAFKFRKGRKVIYVFHVRVRAYDVANATQHSIFMSN